jgi:hypothetical protein
LNVFSSKSPSANPKIFQYGAQYDDDFQIPKVDESFDSLFSYKIDQNYIPRQGQIQIQESMTSRTAAGKYDPEAPFRSLMEPKHDNSINNSRCAPNLNISRTSAFNDTKMVTNWKSAQKELKLKQQMYEQRKNVILYFEEEKTK